MTTVGLVLHDRIRLTLVDASPRDVQAVKRLTGAWEDASTERPDVEIRFHAASSVQLPWRHMGPQDALAMDDRFALASAGGAGPIEIDLPTAGEDSPFRLNCPTGMRTGPSLLRSMINHKCVDKHWLGIHATAFTFSGRGYLACGWPRGGKTGMMLAHLLQGAEYLAAEWVYVDPREGKMHGVPESLRLRDWHLRQGASRLQNVSRRDRLRLWGRRWAAKTAAALATLTGYVRPRFGRSLGKLAAAIERHRYIDRSAADWLQQELRPRSAGLDTVLLVGTHAAEDIRVTPLAPAAAKRRLLALQEEDFSDLHAVYRRWSYAMPEATPCRQTFDRKRSALFDRLLETTPAYAVDHPPNIPLADLFQTLESRLKKTCLQSL
ncbi:hypothetical protein [Roseimaritima ulvae]|uniref:Uncharacterized protein n=1 Tax=Roseimaritima ulvae TaxID=980254 RepID=A0A5B9QWY8_9BACT|nr:hypothetical protein [Roseimaritima ulvae]QEG41895.1 hypothetical protein UC8_39230 [Roseimaritima ulvae]